MMRTGRPGPPCPWALGPWALAARAIAAAGMAPRRARRCMASALQPDIGDAGDLAPLGDLVPDEFAEFLRRAGGGGAAQLDETGLHRRLAQDGADIGVDLPDDPGRRPGRGAE